MTYACAFLIWCAFVALWPTRAELARRRTRNRATVAAVGSYLLHIPGGCLAEPLSAASVRGGITTMTAPDDPTTNKGTG